MFGWSQDGGNWRSKNIHVVNGYNTIFPRPCIYTFSKRLYRRPNYKFINHNVNFLHQSENISRTFLAKLCQLRRQNVSLALKMMAKLLFKSNTKFSGKERISIIKRWTGVYIITISSPHPRGGKNVRLMGKKKTLESRGNEGGRERRGKGKEKWWMIQF